MKKRIFKGVKLSYCVALVIGALLMIQNVEAKELKIKENLKLTEDITDNIVVASGSNVSIDLNGKNITTTGVDAIKVEMGATLNLKGKGVITVKGKGNYACLYNNGKTIINDVSMQKDEKDGNDYYIILNHNDLIINSGKFESIFAEPVDYASTHPSLVDNGYYDFTSTSEKKGYVEGVNAKEVKLTINGGEFIGGLNTIKNDDAGNLVINGGHFRNNVQVAVFNANEAIINGGTFEVPAGEDKTTVFTEYLNDSLNKGLLKITGGTFKADNLLEGWTKNIISITGGNYENIKSLINTTEERKIKSNKDNLGSSNVKLSGGTYYANAFYDVNHLENGYGLFDYNNSIVVDKKSLFELNKVKYYVEKGKSIKLDFTANETGKKYLKAVSMDENIASIKDFTITGVKVGKTNIDLFIGENPLEAAEVIVYEVKNDNTSIKEKNNLDSIINSVVEKKNVKGLDVETSKKLLEAIENNKVISTELNTKEVKSSEVSADTKTKINKILKNNEKVAAFFDINVMLKADDNSIGKITELENTILVSVDIPTSLPELKSGYTRKYYVIRVHNGETTKIDAKLVNGKIEFETDRFSDYALAYSDEIKEKVEESKGKLDDVPKTGYINYTIAFIIFGLLSIISVKLLRRN